MRENRRIVKREDVEERDDDEEKSEASVRDVEEAESDVYI